MLYKNILISLLIIVGVSACSENTNDETMPKTDAQILVFSKTDGYRHDSIEAGVDALKALAADMGLAIHASENGALFNEDNLKQYAAIVFLNTTGDVLDANQQLAMEHFIQAGGGFVGIHAAADTESKHKGWYWYRRLVGGIFKSHPSDPSNVQQAKITVLDSSHPSTAGLDASFSFYDEWYDFQYMNTARHDLLSVDESSYVGAQHGDYHPIAWYNDFDGGRSFYTNLGHSKETYSNPIFLEHLRGGLVYALGDGKAKDYSKVEPSQKAFSREVLAKGFNEPMSFDFFANGDVLIGERRGEIKFFDHETQTVIPLGNPGVEFISETEMGLQGIAIDEQADAVWIYASYTALKDSQLVMKLARFPWRDGAIHFAQEQLMLDYTVERNCCHMGGDIEITDAGELFFSSGDNSNPHDQDGYGPIDFRENKPKNDALRSAGNTQDLRGKVLRIIPLKEGGYGIPEGNLFSNASDGRPEIYVMGARNPFTITFDNKTQSLFFGDVGPDSSKYSDTKGARGYDEVNRVTAAGNFGWPLFVGNNEAYIDYDYIEKVSTKIPFDPDKPANKSPRNTGLKILPPTNAPLLWYPYGSSDEFPELTEGGRTALVADVYRADRYPKETRYPDYYEGKLFISDFVRRWFKVVSFNDDNTVLKIEDITVDSEPSLIIDARFGPDGTLYVLEYGGSWFKHNPDSALSKIAYNPALKTEQSSAVKAEASITDNSAAASPAAPAAPGKALLSANACTSCHKIAGTSVGPAFTEVAKRYGAQDGAQAYIAKRIASGSSGQWSSHAAMPPFSYLSEEDRNAIAAYILSLQ